MTGLTLARDGETGALATRRFAAPPEALFDASLDPALVSRWCLGVGGWTMPVCEIDARPGGAFRYVWVNGAGASFSITGTFERLERPRRIVHVEVMHLPDPTPESHVETLFDPDGTGTLMTMRMRLPDAASRDAMLGPEMEDGMEQNCLRLETLLG